ncbi:hypothetical protein ACFL0D_08830 [Thermoproteota archaeon]
MYALESELSKSFSVRRRDYIADNLEISFFKEDRSELIVTADKMRVHMKAHRAILNQIEEGPFTKHDMDLRNFILVNYPRNRPTPFPWSFNFEPKFEVER